MNIIISTLLVVVGVIHLLPLPGVLSSKCLAALYGLSFSEPNLTLIMRHRAVLFGLLGAFFIYAAFRSTFQRLALIAGFVGVGSFLWLAWPINQYNAHIRRVFIADIVALACLGVAAGLYALN